MAMPLLPGVISTGRLSSLVAFAAVPWFVHLLRVAIGIGTADPASESADLADGIREPSAARTGPPHGDRRHRRGARGGGGAAGDPRDRRRDARARTHHAARRRRLADRGVALRLRARRMRHRVAAERAVVDVVVVERPDRRAARRRQRPRAVRGRVDEHRRGQARPAGPGAVRAGDRRARALAGMAPHLGGAGGRTRDRLPRPRRAAGPRLRSRSGCPTSASCWCRWRSGWRSSAACAVSSFASDVAGGSFGWRQPLGLLSIAAVACGVFPAMITLTDGAWFAPRTSFNDLVAPQIAPDPTGDGSEFGSFRVLYVGDPRLIPVAPEDIGGGISMALTGPGHAAVPRPVRPARTRQPTRSSRLRCTRSPTGRRSAAVGCSPRTASATSSCRSSTAPTRRPTTRSSHRSDSSTRSTSQLDLELAYTAADFMLYENRSAIPAAAMLSGRQRRRRPRSTRRRSSPESTSAMRRACSATSCESRRGTGEVEPGVVHLAVPLRRQLDAAGRRPGDRARTPGSAC